jgi:hypothetical protein
LWCLSGKVGNYYFARVSATNAAGLVGFDDSPTLKITRDDGSLSPGKVAGIVLAAVVGTGLAVGAVAIYFTRAWYTSSPAMPALCIFVPQPGWSHDFYAITMP